MCTLRNIVFAGCAFVVLSTAVQAASVPHDHPVVLDHAPIGVMGEHNHKQGEWMTSYRYMRMDMNDNYIGDDKVSATQVRDDFMAAPTDMTMEMHMVGVMYGVTDELTAMLMLPYVRNVMNIENRGNATIKTESEGLGDVSLSGIYQMYNDDGHKLFLNAGISFPTGSINQRDKTLMGDDQPLPYPMQLGSGTYDLIPGLTYIGHSSDWAWGAQAKATLRTGENDRDYTLGDKYTYSIWGQYAWTDGLSSSLRLQGEHLGDMDGQDDRLNTAVMPTARTDLRGYDRWDLFVGLNWMFQSGWLKDHRLAIEYGFPIYQYLNGPQLGIDQQLWVGWQYAF